MDRRQQILVVAQKPRLANTLVTWLGETGFDLVMVTTFAAASIHLRTEPDLLITEVKLADYNGIHLALKAQADGIPAIVIGPRDRVLQKDAEALDATYLTALPKRSALLALIDQLLSPTKMVAAETHAALVEGPSHAPVSVPTDLELMWRLFPDSDKPASPPVLTRRLTH